MQPGALLDAVVPPLLLLLGHGLQVAERAGVHVTDVKNVIIWGNHSSTQVCVWGGGGGGEHGAPGCVSQMAGRVHS